MRFILIVTALVTAIAAVFGDTTHVVDGARRLNAVGWVVISMAVAAAAASTAIDVRAGIERRKLEDADSQIRAVWEPQLRRALSHTSTLIRYLGVNAKLEQQQGESPVEYNVSGLIQPDRIEQMGLESPGPEVSDQELFELLPEFSVNPVRFPRLAWPHAPSWRPIRYLSIDQRLSQSATEILNEFDELVEQYGDVMPRDRRALVEEIRKSPFLHHLAAIREIAAEAREREDSISYPVHILEPGIQGAPRDSLARLLELLDTGLQTDAK